MSKRVKISDFSKPSEKLTHLEIDDLMPLPPPYDKIEEQPGWKKLTDNALENLETSLDDTIAVGIPKPKTKEEEEQLVQKFLSGLQKLLTKENNWTFLQPLLLSLEHKLT